MNSVSQSEPIDQDENEDKANPLENSLVLRKLFSYLSTRDLLRLSAVSQLWSYEARCVLRDQKKFVAVIEGDRPCARAKKLNDILGSGSSNGPPFSGLNVSILRNHDCVDDVPPAKAEEIYGNLLKMPLKYLKFWWWRESEDCVLGQLLLKLMTRSLTLEELEITDLSRKVGLEQGIGEEEEEQDMDGDEEEEQDMNGGEEKQDTDGEEEDDMDAEDEKQLSCRLPKLSTLQIYNTEIMEAEDEMFWGNFLITVTDGAPNLQLLNNTVKLYWIEFVPGELLRIFQSIKLPRLWPEDEKVLMLMNTFSKQGPKILRLEADCPQISTRGFRMDNYWTLLFDILSHSCGSLKEVILDGRSVVMLRKFAQRKKPLTNVASLEFLMPRNEKSTISRYLLPVPLGDIFPGITSVTIDWGYNEESPWTEDAEPRSCEMFSWDAVTEAEINDLELVARNVRELGTLFPNLRSLSLCDYNDFASGRAFRHIWRWLPYSLQELDMSIALEMDVSPNENFDAEFCGLYEAEAAILREMDDQFLKTVNIVPPFPPVHYRQDLQTIVLNAAVFASDDEDMGTPSNVLFLSKVTGLIALRQMPNLRFYVRADSFSEHLEHLRPFLNLN